MPNLKALIITLFICVILYFVFRLSLIFISPFILSVFICIIIEPLIKILMDKVHLGRNLSITVAILFFCAVFLCLTFVLVSSLYNEILSILKNAPKYYEDINSIINKFNVFIMQNLNIPQDMQNTTGLAQDRILDTIMQAISGLKDVILRVVYSLPDVFMYISFSLLAAFFILKDKDRIMGIIRRYMPEGVRNIVYKINNSIIKIVKTECVLIGVSAVQAMVGLLLLNVEYSIFIGFISGLLDLVPLIGQGLLFIPWIAYSFANGDVVFGLSLSCIYIIIIITRQILQTKLMSGTLDIHPVIILISIYIGLKFFGVAGALLGPLAAVSFKMIYQENVVRCK